MAGQINTVMATDIALNTLPVNQSLNGLRRAIDAIGKSYEAQARQAEDAGNAVKANALRHEGLTQQIDRQSKMVKNLADQQEHLTNIAKDQAGAMESVKNREKEVRDAMKAEADAVGKTSDKYQQLKTKLKDLQAERREVKYAPNNLLKVSRQLEMARIKLSNLQRADREFNPTIGQRLSSSLDRANQALANSKHNVGSFRQVMMGTFAGQTLTNAASSAWGVIKMGIGAATAAGVNFAKQNQVMMATWQTLTGTETGAKGIVSDITTVSNKLGQPIGLTNELEQQFYHVFNDRHDSTQLTKSFETMGDAIGLTSDRLQQVGQDFTHMMASSVLHLGELNQIQDAFPMFGEALLKYEQQVQKNGGLTMNQLRQQISAGKIQSQDAVNVMNQLGQRYSKASENLMGTISGMARQIKAKMSQELGNVFSPLMNSASPVAKIVSQWVQDKSTDSEFKALGEKLNNSVQNVLKAYTGGGNASTITNGLNRAVQGIGNTIESISNFLIKNQATIKASFSLIGSAGKAAFTILGQTIKDVINFLSIFTGGFGKSGSQAQTTAQKIQSLSNALQALTHNQGAVKTIAGTLATVFVIGKAEKFTSFIQSAVIGVLRGLVHQLEILRSAIEFTISAVTKTWNALKILATFSKGTAIKSFNLLRAASVKTASAFKTLAVASSRTLVSAMRGFASLARGAMVSAMGALSRGAKLAASGVRAFNLALKSNPIIAVISLITALIAGFVALYTHNTKFRNFVNGLLSTVVNVAKKIIQYSPPFLLITMFTKLYKQSPAFRNFVNGIVKTVKNVFTGLFNWFKDKFDWLKKKAGEVWNDLKHPLGGGQQKAYASGTSGTTEDQVALVNDARSANYREGMLYNGVLVPFPARRNITTFLPAGAQVINGEAMAKIMHQRQIPHYADGIGALNSFINGETSYGRGQRDAVFKSFMEKVTAEYRKQRLEFLKQIGQAQQAEVKAQAKAKAAIAKAREKMAQALAKAQATLKQALAKAQATFAKAIQKAVQERTQKINAAKADFNKNHDANAYNQKLSEIYAASQKSFTSAQAARQKSINSANSTAQKSEQTAEQTADASTSSAKQELRNTIFEQNKVISLANQNLEKLDAWRQANRSGFLRTAAHFATGGIANRPSIFGEAGPEAAIPLDQMQQGNAWGLLQRVVNFYAGGSNQNQVQSSSYEQSTKLDQVHKDLMQLTGLLQQVVSGQGQQIQATKGIQGYDKDKAGSDLSQYLAGAWNSGLTM